MSPAISTGYVKSPAETNSRLSALSLNCVIRPSCPYEVTAESSQARLGVGRDVALREHRRPVGVEARREQHREQVERAVVEVARVVLHRDRVQVDDAEERLALLLRLRVLAEPADVVAEVLVARRLDAREDPHPVSFRSLRDRKD